MKRGKPIRAVTLERIWPQEKCPVCGKTWTRYCRRDEWGYWYNNSIMQIESKLTLFCSGECAKKFADDKMRKTALRIVGTKAFRARQLYRAGMSVTEVGRALGVSASTVSCLIRTLENVHFTEVKWLDRHPEEVSA